MKTYITEHRIHKHLNTPRINAETFSEAEDKCPNDFIVIGELIEEIECDESIANFYQSKLN